ncbi:ABC transporter lipoprotein releasing system LolD [Gluconobacter thailandicus F149-1 = NBRC 100600]|uniref:ABC transporter ATP-binding protein n=2 Tax=Gluconobacter thailandicus TaxID=257438 RepID=A0AAJ0VHP6_GLUTH|nr:ABC transporter ATP-binding protein [Gluconobacter thailandicus]KXV34415.1 ABC transporter [Gluconobacter thailandicus]KXV53276.1 ABC transporter [Gluconobacter thailandicus]QEH97482.1 ABC transporter ATP-binding protein [Gluconobacter thailandicus]GAC86926.1 lipoprotein releasing system ATP-binding protein [Gluconobacter thailandicus NBRC 3255]GAD25117.1 lipoprotein releasing system ATP-binding protein [Gluconobacter thailandicus NBRC 3257]
MSEARMTALRLENLTRRFQSGEETLEILSGADFSLFSGEIVALVAPSGTGKSTLLHLAGLLEAPTEGAVYIDEKPVSGLSDTVRTAVRRDQIGFVYQFHHLLGEFTACENVMLPQLVAGVSAKAAKARAEDLLGRFGLSHRLNSLPGRLSGGEQQRTAIARALANRPKLLLADEPTGNLDVATSDHVFDELLRVVREEGVAALIATHNKELAARMDRTVTLRGGKLVAF